MLEALDTARYVMRSGTYTHHHMSLGLYTYRTAAFRAKISIVRVSGFPNRAMRIRFAHISTGTCISCLAVRWSYRTIGSAMLPSIYHLVQSWPLVSNAHGIAGEKGVPGVDWRVSLIKLWLVYTWTFLTAVTSNDVCVWAFCLVALFLIAYHFSTTIRLGDKHLEKRLSLSYMHINFDTTCRETAENCTVWRLFSEGGVWFLGFLSFIWKRMYLHKGNNKGFSSTVISLVIDQAHKEERKFTFISI